MASEKPVHPYSRVDRAIGTVSANLIDRFLLRRVLYEGAENMSHTNDILKSNGSILVVPDHADLTATLYSANFMLMLEAAQNRAVVMTQAYESGQMGNVGRIALRIVDHYGVEPIFVMTKKYVPDFDIRNRYNEGQKEVIKTFLRSPGNALLMYPEGTRQAEMGEARKGFSEFASETTAVVPLTTVVEKGKKPRIIIHEPIPGKGGIAKCIELFGEELGRQVFSDLVMTMIASGQPNEKKRGAYKETCANLERYLLNQSGGTPELQDPRSIKVIEAYSAWKAGAFGIV